jgi:malonyl-CoA/methylmalonyl-CoA synthetase
MTTKGELAPEAEIIATLSGSLAKFKVPKRIFAVDELPRNAMGKVQKAELRKRYADTFTS